MLYLDLDGVLADFEAQYVASFGRRAPGRLKGSDWDPIRSHGRFFLDMPMTPDCLELWAGVRHLAPAILSGIPRGMPEVIQHKVSWVRERLGDVPVVCCATREKALYCRPGDVLVDDYCKYSHLWRAAGGAFVLHVSARQSLAAIAALF